VILILDYNITILYGETVEQDRPRSMKLATYFYLLSFHLLLLL